MANEGQQARAGTSQPESEWQDPTTVKGFVGGLISSGFNVVIFLGLSALVGLLAGFPTRETPAGSVYAPLELAVLLSSVLLGAGLVFRFRESPRASRYLGSSRGRLAMMGVFYGAYLLLILYDMVLALLAGGAYTAAKLVTVSWLFVRSRF